MELDHAKCWYPKELRKWDDSRWYVQWRTLLHHLLGERLGMWTHMDLVHEHIPKDRDDHM